MNKLFSAIPVRPLNELSETIQHLVKGRLWLKVILGIVLGAGTGVLLNPDFGLVSAEWNTSLGSWLNLPGEVFMKLMQMVMIPLIFASIISGLVSNVSDNLRSFSLWLFAYFIFTTIVAITLGTIVSFMFNPGEYISALGGFSGEVAAAAGNQEEVVINIPKAISNLIPVNPLQAILSGEMLAVVIFTVIIGIAITQLEASTAAPLMRFVEAIQKICMIIVGWAMRLVPYAVFGLMASLLSTTGIDIFVALGYYMMVVVIGLVLLMGFYMLIYAVVKRENPLRFLSLIKDPLLLAFSTASSAAVMPLSMKTADEKLGVSSKISDFVIPIGATINMDGTALFQCITVLFMAQAYGVELAMINVLLITVTVVAASIGTPAIPGGGVVVLASVLGSVGIPVDGLVVIIGIDRVLGMFRTTVNVTGDLTATAVFDKVFGK